MNHIFYLEPGHGIPMLRPMSKTTTLPWQEPLALLPHTNGQQHVVLLYSGAQMPTHHISYLCLGAKRVMCGSDIRAMHNMLGNSLAWHENFWIGYLGYGLKNQLESLREDAPSAIDSDDYYLFQPQTIYRFDHQAQSVECAGPHSLKEYWDAEAPAASSAAIGAQSVAEIESNMTERQYLAHAQTILNAIHAGDLYQANLTRKFYGTLKHAAKPAAMFAELCNISPAAYSAYLCVDGMHVLSSSPEQFLRINASGSMHSTPIKGTIARSADAVEDARNKVELKASAKDRAENLMIVDLMRNDFSRSCGKGSVAVDGLFDITSHAHIHHMSSHVSGQLQPDISALNATLACFPPGSMTGAPKISAMELCSALEGQKRGIYSGAIGYFAGDGSAELSVVIRTLIMRGKQFEFQVGGGIVADSTPQAELEETYAKATGISRLLGINLRGMHR